MSNALAVGTRFTSRSSRGWRDEAGNRHRHTYTLECVVTALTPAGFAWDRLEVLSEADAPTEGAFVPERGEMAWFGWEAASNRGDVDVVA